MKQDQYSTANQLWNAGATEIQQLNPCGPDQRQIIRQRNDPIFTLKMSLRRENLEELRIILFEMFAVHLKIVCVYYFL